MHCQDDRSKPGPLDTRSTTRIFVRDRFLARHFWLGRKLRFKKSLHVSCPQRPATKDILVRFCGDPAETRASRIHRGSAVPPKPPFNCKLIFNNNLQSSRLAVPSGGSNPVINAPPFGTSMAISYGVARLSFQKWRARRVATRRQPTKSERNWRGHGRRVQPMPPAKWYELSFIRSSQEERGTNPPVPLSSNRHFYGSIRKMIRLRVTTPASGRSPSMVRRSMSRRWTVRWSHRHAADRTIT